MNEMELARESITITRQWPSHLAGEISLSYNSPWNLDMAGKCLGHNINMKSSA